MSDDTTMRIRRVEGYFRCTACGVEKETREDMKRHLESEHMEFRKTE